MNQNKGYQMSMDEVRSIVSSCERRGIYFNTIELTGGEVSVWDNLEFGVEEFSRICDTVTLATNGNNPSRIKSLGLKTWIVSESQATKQQMAEYREVWNRLTINSHKHKKLPDHPYDNVLPAICCTRKSPQGVPQIAVEYIKGKVYYCPDCFTHTEYVPLTEDLICDFEDDFLSKFADKKFDKEICRWCLGNAKIWEKI